MVDERQLDKFISYVETELIKAGGDIDSKRQIALELVSRGLSLKEAEQLVDDIDRQLIKNTTEKYKQTAEYRVGVAIGTIFLMCLLGWIGSLLKGC